MAAINKPLDINKIWSASGDVLAPSDTKISQGWAVEIPPRQYFNYIDNKQDQAIAHINQYGIALWDAVTEYQFGTVGGKSLVMGSNGVVYRAKQTHTNQNPVLDTSNIYWEVAFTSTADVTKVATATQARAQTDNSVFLSPLQLANAFSGLKQSLLVNGYQVLPGGLILQWGGVRLPNANTQTPFPFNIPFPNQCFKLFITTDNDVNVVSASQGYIVNNSTGSASVATPNTGITWFAIGN